MKPFAMIILSLILNAGDFKTTQLKYPRVKEAYKEKETLVTTNLSKLHLKLSSLEIYIRAFKSEQLLEVWGRNKGEARFQKIMSYEICLLSGIIGPKRKEGDLQVPEGFYHISHFNPESSYYLSLGINYPNASDKVFADKQNPGGSIYIHGKCVTIGCLPITDDKIKELYILALEARNNGQTEIQVTIYPGKLDERNFELLKTTYRPTTEVLILWEDLKKAYQKFETEKKIPQVQFLKNGKHKIL